MNNRWWPECLKIQINKPNRNLRCNISAPRLSVPLIQGTFQASSATLSNSLQVNIRICDNYNQFCRYWKRLCTDKITVMSVLKVFLNISLKKPCFIPVYCNIFNRSIKRWTTNNGRQGAGQHEYE